jgi:hypothetical protein
MLDMWTVYSENGITLEEEVTDPETGEDSVELVTIPQTALQELQASVKVDITPKGAFDKYAQELSIENMFQAGKFNPQMLAELKIYVRLLDDDSVMPKQKLLEAIDMMEEEQQRIAIINAQAQQMKMRANQFIMGDPESQAQQMLDAQMPTEEEATLQ